MPEGSVGVPIRLADPAALSVVRPGNRIDLLRAEGGAGSLVATSALVLAVSGDPATGSLLLALSRTEADRVLATPTQGFAILIRPG